MSIQTIRTVLRRKKEIRQEIRLIREENQRLYEELVLRLKPWLNFHLWRTVCMNPNLSLSFIEAHPTLFRDNYFGLSLNPNITLDYVLAHIDHPWNWDRLSSNPGIKIAEIESHPELPWSIKGLSYHPGLTMAFVESHLDWDWNWSEIAKVCPDLTIEHVRKYKNHFWKGNWGPTGFALNPAFTAEDLVNHSELGNSIYGYQRNPNFTLDELPLLRTKEPGFLPSGCCLEITLEELLEVNQEHPGVYVASDLAKYRPLEEITAHPELEWGKGVARNPYLSLQKVLSDDLFFAMANKELLLENRFDGRIKLLERESRNLLT